MIQRGFAPILKWRYSYSPKRSRAFFEDDGGFSTAGMAIALLLSLALVFGSVQVYRIQSACADVQNVADAAALAAENQVASFYVVAQICDAVVLTLTLTGVVCTGIGVVALCVPAGQPIGEKLIETGARIFDARTRFAKSVAKGLDTLQQALPVIAAAQAARVAHANNSSASNYFAVALLAPLQGQPIAEVSAEHAQGLVDDAQQLQDDIEQAAQKAEDAAIRAHACKEKAYEADCGANPSYCMYERAGKLAGLSGSSNPYYGSVEAWSFSVALQRAKAYYPQRLAREAPANGSVEEQGSSVLRRHFYSFACDEIRKGYIHESEDSFDAFFPLLPRNTSEMRSTPLYTAMRYPITVDDAGTRMMHAWSGCPVVQERGSVGNGSVSMCESEHMPTCSACEFSASRVGKIAAASTSITNGFEHYYRIVAEQAELYQKAREEQAKAAQKVKDPVEGLMDQLSQALEEAANARIHVTPPGSLGAIAVVADTAQVPAGSLVPAQFVSSAGSIGARAAIAGATLACDTSDETSNVITSFFDGFIDHAGSIAVVPQVLAGFWGHALQAYLQGKEGVVQGVRETLNALPLVGPSRLGEWAAEKIDGVISAAGLQPAELSAYKPVLVNTYHVASADTGSTSQGIVSAKQAYSGALGQGTGNPVAVLVGAAGGTLSQSVESVGDEIVIADVRLLGETGPSFDVRIPLPAGISEGAQGLIASATAAIQGLVGAGGTVPLWE